MTRRLRRLIALIGAGLALAAGSAWSQPRPLTLADAVAQAVARYPAVRAATEQSRQAEANVSLSRSTFLPRADLVWQANRATRNNLSGLLLPQSVIGSITGPVTTTAADSAWNHAAGALVAWEPVDFGARAAAVESAPVVQQQAARVAAAEASETAIARAYAPRIVIEATAFTRESGIGPDGTAGAPLQAAHNWAAGVNVTFPLFDGSAQGARRAVEHARVGEAAARYDQAIVEVRTERARAQASHDAALKIAALSAPQLEAARAAEEQARARYTSGLGTIADVADTSRLLTDAEVNVAVASLNVARAMVAVAAAGGHLESVMIAVRAVERR